MSDTLGAAQEYVRRGWRIVPIQHGEKRPAMPGWPDFEAAPEDLPRLFGHGENVAMIVGSKSGDVVDIDLDCTEAIALADLYLPATRAEFGRASKPRSHRLFIAPTTTFEAFSDPIAKDTLLELRADGRDGGAHLTLLPPSTTDGELREWHGDIIAPAGYEARKLRRRCAFLAMACLLSRHVSQHAAERPGPDFPRLLWEADHMLGRAAYRWLDQPVPDAPREAPKPRYRLTQDEINLAEVVDAIPNNEDWHGWNRIGLAIYGASGGSDQGGIVFDDWSGKSQKYNPYTTAARWRHYHHSPPDRIGMGTLIHLAREAGWAIAEKRRHDGISR